MYTKWLSMWKSHLEMFGFTFLSQDFRHMYLQDSGQRIILLFWSVSLIPVLWFAMCLSVFDSLNFCCRKSSCPSSCPATYSVVHTILKTKLGENCSKIQLQCFAILQQISCHSCLLKQNFNLVFLFWKESLQAYSDEIYKKRNLGVWGGGSLTMMLKDFLFFWSLM